MQNKCNKHRHNNFTIQPDCTERVIKEIQKQIPQSYLNPCEKTCLKAAFGIYLHDVRKMLLCNDRQDDRLGSDNIRQ